MSDNIIVAIRIRPFITRERDCSSYWTVEQTNQIRQVNIDEKHLATHVYDRVYDQVSSTDEVYNDTAAPIVEAAMLGFHGTIFAYGQTSSGKTHTMTGDKDFPGIVQLAVEDIFNTIENSPEREFLIRVSYLEIYQENVVDLLGNLAKHLDIKENYHGTVFVENLKENVATSVEEVMKEMKKAEVNRHIGATKMNERSSRSHTIFRVIIESHLRTDESGKSDDVDDAVMVAHLNFVDLAGSENAKQTAASGQRLAESCAINKSLLSLSLVIGQLSTGSTFVNYRNSRLTRILQNALGGNSKTAIICTISPASLEQSISTLRFATSAKSIKNKPVVNEVISGETMLKRYKKEINELKRQLEEAKCASSKVRSNSRMSRSKEDKIELLTRLFCVSSQLGGATGARQKANMEARRRETWCPGRGGMPLPPFLATGGTAYPQPLLPPSMLPTNSPEPSPPRLESQKAEPEDKQKCHLEEIACITQSRDEAVEQAEAVRNQLIEIETVGHNMISKYQQQVADLEAKLQSATLEAEDKHKLHLAEKACLTQDCEETKEELEAARLQINDMQNLGKEMMSKHNHQVELIEAELKAAKEEQESAACKLHLAEIVRLTQDCKELREEAEATRTQINDMQNLEKEMISRHNHQVALLEAELKATREDQESAACAVHLVEIAHLTQDCDEVNEELEAARTQINDLQNLGREMISKRNHQVALLEADLEAANKKQQCISCEHHLEEIARLTQSRSDAVEEVETVRRAMAEMKATGVEMIQKLQQHVSHLEAELKTTREERESLSCKLHLVKIARLKQDCEEAEEELETARIQIAKLQQQVVQLEAQLQSIKNESQHYITLETYENERQRLMRCCDEADDELEAVKRSQAVSDREKKELLEEVEQLKKTIAKGQIKVTMLERELDKVQEPHIHRIKFFEKELDKLGKINKQLKNEIRHLHNKQSNESFLQPRQMKGSQKMEEYTVGEKEFLLQVEIKRLSKKVEALQAALDSQGN